MPGVKRVVTIEGHENPTWLKPGVAVVADSTWAAMKGREALRVTWDEGAGRDESSASLSAQFRALAATPGKVLGDQGDVARAFAPARTKVDVIYEAPFLAHATLEPQNCIAHVHDGRCEIRRAAADADVGLAGRRRGPRHPARGGVDSGDADRRRLRAAADVGLRGRGGVRVEGGRRARCRWSGRAKTTCGTTTIGRPGCITCAPGSAPMGG